MDAPTCAICWGEATPGDRDNPASKLPCQPVGHVFHQACLKDWLLKSDKCPLCPKVKIPPALIGRDVAFNEQGMYALADQMHEKVRDNISARHESHDMGQPASPTRTWAKLGKSFMPQVNDQDEDARVLRVRNSTILSDQALAFVRDNDADACQRELMRLILRVRYVIREGEERERNLNLYMGRDEPISSVGSIYDQCRFLNPPRDAQGPFFVVQKSGKTMHHSDTPAKCGMVRGDTILHIYNMV